ncbi:hypothetical protein [Streptomyces oceani]|uniref:Uncharacterized protein n=1 Tax=Streptomyces oceani TaxID=1075402 RepID=A0A1E7JVZ4_9ACTN|nr:hypothetical protein [Streptomyces oceani]OEU95487.1 hypothetical protein AN216_23590 [Streptomyces oceani]
MTSGPTLLGGSSFALFGVGLLLWTVTRLWQRLPVAAGVPQVTAATLAGCVGVLSAAVGGWLLLSG